MNAITDGSCLNILNYLLEFLATWEKQPAYLTLMAYQWCSAISNAAGRLSLGEISISLPDPLELLLRRQSQLQPQDLATSWHISGIAEMGFREVGLHRDPVRLDATFHHTHQHPQNLIPHVYPYLLSITLEIRFRHVTPSHHQSALHLDHTINHEWVFETTFSSDDDEVIADALCVWIVDSDSTAPGSCACYLSKHVESGAPFSHGLQRVCIRAIECIWPNKLKVSLLDTICWLNHLNIDVDDMVEKESWA